MHSGWIWPQSSFQNNEWVRRSRPSHNGPLNCTPVKGHHIWPYRINYWLLQHSGIFVEACWSLGSLMIHLKNSCLMESLNSLWLSSHCSYCFSVNKSQGQQHHSCCHRQNSRNSLQLLPSHCCSSARELLFFMQVGLVFIFDQLAY